MSKLQRDIEKIDFTGYEWRPRKPVKHIRPNLAIDSETVNGKPFLMASSNLKGVNHIFSDNIDDYLYFLTSEHFIQSNNFWYNLDYDAAGIIKMLPEENVIELINNTSTTYKGFELKYIVSKVLKIKNPNRQMSTHYDLAQFYDMKPLKELASLTQYNKVDVEDIANIDLKRINNDSNYRKLLIDRCVIDARITKELADSFTDKVNLVVYNNRYYSVASISRAYFLTNLPKRLKLPSKRIMGYGLNAYHGGMVEVLKLGTFKNAFNIDIRSAYPSIMANLYSCNGIWTSKPEYISDTAYSFYKANVDFYDDDISPLWFTHKNKDYHPTGNIETYLTQFEYEFLINKGFDVEILAATHLLKSKDHNQPFYELINNLYDMRADARERGDPIQLIYKLIENAAYGCTINSVEKRILCSLKEWEDDGSNPNHVYDVNGQTMYFLVQNVSTSMYNPVFAAYITSGCRIQLLNKVWKYRDKVISLNTDGAFLSSKIPVHDSKRLGEWSTKIYDKIMVVGNGRYFIYDHDGTLNTKKSAFRGLRAAKKNMPVIDKQMEDNPDKLGVPVDYVRPLKIRECVRAHNIERINIFTPESTTLDFKIERRVWNEEIKTNGDLMDKQIGSRPFTVEEVKGLK